MARLKIYDSEEEMNAATGAASDALPGQEEAPPPAVRVEAFVRQHTGNGIRHLNSFTAINVVAKAVPEERDQVKAEIVRARPDLATVFDQELPARAPKKAKKEPHAGAELLPGEKIDFSAPVDSPAAAWLKGKAAPIIEDVPPIPMNEALPSARVEKVPSDERWIPVDGAQVALDQLHESPTNPRRHFDETALAELAKSIESAGVLQPLLCRPSGGGKLEIVCGARRFRAAKIAGCSHVPVVIRELSDLAVLEAQLVENVQRQDVTPLEEADAYGQLHQKHGYSVDQIAAKVGKTKATVYARMKLAGLSTRGRELVESGKLPATHALLIARIPGEKLQNQALEELIDPSAPDIQSYRSFADEVGRRFTLDLSSAPFDPADDMLLAGTDDPVGACAPCPFRSGNCRELTSDIKSANVCTSPACYQRKVKASTASKIAALEAQGIQPIAKADAKKLFSYGDELQWTADFVEIDKPHPADQKRRTWKQLLEKAEKGSDDLIARRALIAPSGKVLIVVDRKEAEKRLKKLEGSSVAKKVVEDEAAKEERKKEEAAKVIRDRVAVEVARAAAAHAQKKERIDLPVLRLLASEMSGELFGQSDEMDRVVLELAGAKDASELEKKITTKIEAPALCGLLTIAALAVAGGFENHGGYNEAIKQFAKTLGLDLRALEKDQRALVEIADQVEAATKAKAKHKSA
jgi:ParB/RepB/Spo0J family partition protein